MKGVIILDRDGVLNEMVIEPEHGLVDSPMNLQQVRVFDWVPECIRDLTVAGYEIHIATNQPAATKGKTTLANLQKVQSEIQRIAESAGGKIHSVQMCEDLSGSGSNRRKPAPGMLLKIMSLYPDEIKSQSWMVGDGITDVEAGVNAGLKTAFLGPEKCDHFKIFDERLGLRPDFWGKNLKQFCDFLLQGHSS